MFWILIVMTFSANGGAAISQVPMPTESSCNAAMVAISEAEVAYHERNMMLTGIARVACIKVTKES